MDSLPVRGLLMAIALSWLVSKLFFDGHLLNGLYYLYYIFPLAERLDNVKSIF